MVVGMINATVLILVVIPTFFLVWRGEVEVATLTLVSLMPTAGQ